MSDRPFTLPPGGKFRLKDFDPGWTGTYKDKGEAKPEIQKNLERLRERQQTPSKQWKSSPGDLEPRKLWDDYIAAFEDALIRCTSSPPPHRDAGTLPPHRDAGTLPPHRDAGTRLFFPDLRLSCPHSHQTLSHASQYFRREAMCISQQKGHASLLRLIGGLRGGWHDPDDSSSQPLL